MTTKGGTSVAHGQHVVPEGIAVEEISDREYLAKKCPPALQTLLHDKKLQKDYVQWINELSRKGTSDGKTWKVPALVECVQKFQKQFASSGIRLAVCCWASACGSYRWYWIEYVDMADADFHDYQPKYDISSYTVVLHKSHAIPSKGVAIHEMDDWAMAKKLQNKLPQAVKDLVESKGAGAVYQKLVQAITDTKTNNTRTWTGSWKTTEVLAVVQQYQNELTEQYDLEIAVCKCQDPRDDWEYLKWLEIIDRKVVGDAYVPTYSVDEAKRKDLSERMSSTRGGGSSNVAVEQLVVDGTPQLAEDCPGDVKQLLERKGLDVDKDYGKLDAAIAASQSLRNFCDIWRLQDQGLIQFAALDDFRSCFAKKGVRTILCESVGRTEGRNYWLEYVDVQASPDYNTPYNVNYVSAATEKKTTSGDKQSYKTVIHGHHKVPAEGVFVEELGGVTKLTDKCSPEVEQLLKEKGLMSVYHDCMKSIASAKNTRSWSRNWKSDEILAVLQDYDKPFQAQGVKVVLCKLKPDKGISYRWFEFIDTAKAKTYVPQYDVSSYDDSLELVTTTLHFPKGVAVEKLMDKKTVMETVPPSVKTMMDDKGCMDLYNALVDVLCQSVVGDDNNDPSEAHMKELTNVLGPKFESKGVTIYISGKTESALDGTSESFWWVEFVDRSVQPNYVAQRGIDMKKLPTEGFSKEQVMVTSSVVAIELAQELLFMGLPVFS